MVFINRSHVLILFVNFSVVGGCDDTYYGKTKPQACNFIKKETLAQVLSCELCEISKNISLTEHVWTKEHCASSRSETVYWYIVLFGSSLSYALQKCTALRMFT